MSTAAKKKINEVDASIDDILDRALEAEPKDVKIHISCRLDLDVYRELKRLAAEEGEKYQSLMNDVLRKFLFKNKSVRVKSEREKDVLKLAQAIARKIQRDKLMEYATVKARDLARDKDAYHKPRGEIMHRKATPRPMGRSTKKT